MPNPFGPLLRAAFVALLAAIIGLFSGKSVAAYLPQERHAPHSAGSADVYDRKPRSGGRLLLTERGRRGWDDNRSMERQYREWQSLPPDQKEMLRRRMERYRDLSPQERDLYRRRYQQWQELSPEERDRIQRDLKRWQYLSPQERDAIRRRFGR